MIDIYEYLKLDHKKVSKLFDLYETQTDPELKLNIIEMITKELLVHAESESRTFYRELKECLESKDKAFHGEEEHEEIKAKLKEISKHRKADAALNKKVKALRKLVEHHVSDEEGKIFRAAKKVLSDEDAYRLKEQMHYYKFKLLTMHKNKSTLSEKDLFKTDELTPVS